MTPPERGVIPAGPAAGTTPTAEAERSRRRAEYIREWKRTHPEYLERQRERDRLRRPSRPAKKPTPESRRLRRLRVRERNRERLAAIKIARGCADCGYRSHAEALDFDHLPGTSKRAPNMKALFACGWGVIAREIEKCEVVCANCHRIRTATRRMTS